MADKHPKRRRLREESMLEELLDRDGHWTREFPSRSIIWPIIEHWAAENGYHLVALRANRRLYQLGEEGGSFVTYFELAPGRNPRAGEGLVAASFRARAFRAFLLPAEVPMDPRGWVGLRYRRFICRTLNSFLERCGQPPILHSKNFHPADLDATTLILELLAPLVAPGFSAYRSALAFRLPPFPWKIETVDAMVTPLAIPVVGVAAVLRDSRRPPPFRRRPPFRPARRQMGLARGRARARPRRHSRRLPCNGASRVLVRRVTTECFPTYHNEICSSLVESLTPEQRIVFADRLRTLHNELVRH